MSKRLRERLRRTGIVLHGNKLWISEPISLLFVLPVVMLIFFLIFSILRNEFVIHFNNKKCAALRAERAELSRLLGELSSKERIAVALRGVVGGAVAQPVFHQLIELVHANSKTFGYDPLLVLAVIQVESLFEPTALGRFRNMRLSGALGLMQVKPETAREMAAKLGMPIPEDKDLFKPDVNIALGIAYLTQCIGRFKSFKLGLLAYNQGPGVIRERLQENQPQSIDYYKRVLKKYYALRKAAEPRF
jgi:soluble lytic murein transglycosylase-like protein